MAFFGFKFSLLHLVHQNIDGHLPRAQIYEICIWGCRVLFRKRQNLSVTVEMPAFMVKEVLRHVLTFADRRPQITIATIAQTSPSGLLFSFFFVSNFIYFWLRQVFIAVHRLLAVVASLAVEHGL